MIKILAIGIVAVVTAVHADVLTFTTRPDKNEFGFFEPIEITSEIRVSRNSLRQPYPEGISGNVVYEVEYQSRGTFLPIPESRKGGGGYLWGAKVEDVATDNSPLVATMDLRILFNLEEPGRYRVRGNYRSDNRSSTFEKTSEWSEFEINPQTQSETIALEAFEGVGAGKTHAEHLASYQAFAAKYPTDHITARLYPEILDFYLKRGEQEHAIVFLKSVINNPNISKIKRRLFAYEIAGLEEKSGRVDEAIRWYRQSGLRNGEERIEKLQGKAQ